MRICVQVECVLGGKREGQEEKELCFSYWVINGSLFILYCYLEQIYNGFKYLFMINVRMGLEVDFMILSYDGFILYQIFVI